MTYFFQADHHTFHQWARCLGVAILLVCSFMTFADVQPPPANDVFVLTTKPVDPNTFTLDWIIKPGFFLYRDRIALTNSSEESLHLAKIPLPPSVSKKTPQGEHEQIYREQLKLPISILGEQAGEAILNLRYQGCSDTGFCYPPESRQVKLSFNDKHELFGVDIEASAFPASNISIAAPVQHEDETLRHLFSSQNWIVIFFSFFGFGLLLSFTPCVLPMIPVLSGIILGQGKKISTHKSFLLSLSYILSMATTYALVGATVALIGRNIQLALQSPWFIAAFSLVFVLLALSMFGFYDLKLPSTWQSKLTKISHSRAGGYYVGAAIMGCLSTLILSPCVTAPLVGALGYIASSGDVARGSLSLFFLGLGMGTPLLLIGTFAGKWVPRAGQWMVAIKVFFGLLLIAVAINLLGRILPPVLVMWLWASLFIFTGIYSGALTHARHNLEKFRQGVGIITLIYGILILIGASQGSQNPLQPLVQPPTSTYPNTPEAKPNSTYTTLTEVQRALTRAHGKPVFMDFYADWCASCKHMEATTLKNPQIQKLLANFEVIRVDVTGLNQESHELLRHFKVVAPPTFIFYNRKGNELTQLQMVGDISPEQLLKTLSEILTAHPPRKERREQLI
jgi:thiol:disulfide interchange protein DsbD